MTLTPEDLQAIKKIVDNAVEDAKLQTAAGFAEVDEKFAKVDEKFAELDKRLAGIDEKLDDQATDTSNIKATVNRIENIQQAEVTRTDTHAEEITRIKRKLKII